LHALPPIASAVHGTESLKAVDIVDRQSGSVRREDSGAVFVFIGADAETAWLPAAIARDDHGYLLTGNSVLKAARWQSNRDPYLLETSVPGIFACGDGRSGLCQARRGCRRRRQHGRRVYPTISQQHRPLRGNTSQCPIDGT
jgi:thioredoxin reductase